MINLDIESYCNNCDGFEAKTIKMETFHENGYFSDTTIQCENKRKCARMYEHIKREVQKNAGYCSGS